jgi:hypothetical protein
VAGLHAQVVLIGSFLVRGGVWKDVIGQNIRRINVTATLKYDIRFFLRLSDPIEICTRPLSNGSHKNRRLLILLPTESVSGSSDKCHCNYNQSSLGSEEP